MARVSGQCCDVNIMLVRVCCASCSHCLAYFMAADFFKEPVSKSNMFCLGSRVSKQGAGRFSLSTDADRIQCSSLRES